MRVWILIVAMTFGSSLLAQETPKRDTDFSEELTKSAEALKMTWPDDPNRSVPTLLKTPVLKCNDPTRQEIDGAVWLWLDGKRPVTAMCLLKYAGGKSNYEFVSLCDQAVMVSGRPEWSWEPVATVRTWVKLDDAVPAEPRGRQSAMKALARRLEATEFYRGQTFTLRLLERPIYSYADEEHGVKEGAIFALSNGTNPEVLAQIEARHDKTDAWYLACARLSSAAASVKLGEKEIWSAEAIDTSAPRDPRDPYYSVSERP